jgi:hypothetical protein
LGEAGGTLKTSLGPAFSPSGGFSSSVFEDMILASSGFELSGNGFGVNSLRESSGFSTNDVSSGFVSGGFSVASSGSGGVAGDGDESTGGSFSSGVWVLLSDTGIRSTGGGLAGGVPVAPC